MRGLSLWLGAGAVSLIAALPGTSNYQLRNYGIGSGGTADSSTSNYSLEGIAGELSGQDMGSSTYGLRPGLLGSQLANLPDAPLFTNPSDWYNKLHIVLNTSDNPTDTAYAIAISTDNFATTQYVQLDNTVGSSLDPSDFQTYAAWGGGSGTDIIGLEPGITYQVKVKARQGEFSETGFGPSASAATSDVSLTFDIDIAATDSKTSPPYVLDFGELPPDTVTDTPNRIWLDIESNAMSGAFVFIVSQNSGLASASASYTIASLTGDLGSIGEGLGAQSASIAQASGGPLTVSSPYNGLSNSIGVVDNQFRQLLTSNAQLYGGRASFILKAKTTSVTPAAGDYTDMYTLVATAGF